MFLWTLKMIGFMVRHLLLENVEIFGNIQLIMWCQTYVEATSAAHVAIDTSYYLVSFNNDSSLWKNKFVHDGHPSATWTILVFASLNLGQFIENMLKTLPIGQSYSKVGFFLFKYIKYRDWKYLSVF